MKTPRETKHSFRPRGSFEYQGEVVEYGTCPALFNAPAIRRIEIGKTYLFNWPAMLEKHRQEGTTSR